MVASASTAVKVAPSGPPAAGPDGPPVDSRTGRRKPAMIIRGEGKAPVVGDIDVGCCAGRKGELAKADQLQHELHRKLHRAVL